MFDFNELCKELQEKYEFLIDLIQKNINDIWKDSIAEEEKSKNLPFKEIVYKSDYSKLGNINNNFI